MGLGVVADRGEVQPVRGGRIRHRNGENQVKLSSLRSDHGTGISRQIHHTKVPGSTGESL